MFCGAPLSTALSPRLEPLKPTATLSRACPDNLGKFTHTPLWIKLISTFLSVVTNYNILSLHKIRSFVFFVLRDKVCRFPMA